MGKGLNIETPRWAAPLLEPARYKGVHGGRGSGKSHFFAELLVEEHVVDPNQKSVCLREVQKSIRFSVKGLIESKIEKLGVQDYFDIQGDLIRSKNGNGVILFQGMQNHTADSIKSLEGFKRAWFEEAQKMSAYSLQLLRPTIRLDDEDEDRENDEPSNNDSQLWFSWNPRHDTDAIDVLLRSVHCPPDSIVVQANFIDNPWLPRTLRKEMEFDRGRDPDAFDHTWMGGYEKHSESRVFRNWRVEEFETHRGAMLKFGADWGFSNDPTVLVRGHIEGRTLYIDYEAAQVGCEIMDIPELFLSVPESEKWPIIADSSRPETISHVRKHGFPKIVKAVKGKGSIEDGIEFLKTYDIVIHPRCPITIKEFTNYRYKIDEGVIDPVTNRPIVTNQLEDKDNHVIDSVRYMLEGARRLQKASKDEEQDFELPSAGFRW